LANISIAQDSTDTTTPAPTPLELKSDSSSNFPHGKYPYHLPIWGQKAQDIGMGDRLQLPFGISAMYVNSSMDVAVTDFSMTIGNNEALNDLLAQIVNVNTLNFYNTTATVNGINVRADAWLLPFCNVYGMYTQVTGGTTVSLQPTWYLTNGETIQTPQINSTVEFLARSFGIGNTWAYGVKKYFASVDYNYTWSKSELLVQTLGLLTASGRVGRSFKIGKKMKLSGYVGAMYRDFTNNDPSNGSLKLSEALPGLEDGISNGINGRISANEETIGDLQSKIDGGGKPSDIVLWKKQQDLLESRNESLADKDEEIKNSGVYDTEINYRIKKELLYPWTFQFGFNLEVNKHLMLRGEYGVSQHQRLLLTGINYRFGFKKKS
jgi:hypothetical protein